MIIIIQRKTDNKYLQSIEEDIWVENIKESFEMNYIEFKNVKETLLNTYSTEDLKDVIDFKKLKKMTNKEKKEFQELLSK